MTPGYGPGAGSGTPEVGIRMAAPAKLNLGLEVIGRRDDGFHEIATIFVAITLYDHLTLTPADELEITCDDDTLAGGDNLALRALQVLHEETHHRGGARIELSKRIPAAAGLGGASSDAAAALVGGRDLWGSDIGDDRLHEIAARLGSDVPFFLRGGCAMGKGRGELLEPLPLPQGLWFVVVVPDVVILRKTATLFSLLNDGDFSDGSRIAGQGGRLAAGLPLDEALLENAFARPLYALAPDLADLPRVMRDAGASTVAISGAGPAHYSIAGDEGEAEQIAARVRDRLGGQAQVFVAVPAPPRQQEPVPHRADGVMGDPCDGSAVNSTRITQHVKASRASVYRALLDAKAVETWMVPTGMTSQVHMFEPREGGSFRISLTYEEPTGTGKTTSHTDTHHGRFVRLVPNEQLVEVVEFETSDPAMRGEMTITITLIDADGGTDVLAVHDGLPPGVSTADNEIGWRLSLAKLAALVEAGE